MHWFQRKHETCHQVRHKHFSLAPELAGQSTNLTFSLLVDRQKMFPSEKFLHRTNSNQTTEEAQGKKNWVDDHLPERMMSSGREKMLSWRQNFRKFFCRKTSLFCFHVHNLFSELLLSAVQKLGPLSQSIKIPLKLKTLWWCQIKHFVPFSGFSFSSAFSALFIKQMGLVCGNCVHLSLPWRKLPGWLGDMGQVTIWGITDF